MTLADGYALGLFLLGAWGVFSSRRSFKRVGWWSWPRGQIFLADVLFAGGCWLSAAGLRGGWFAPWMLVPIGASLLWMIPLPCYFEAVERIGWLHTVRNLFFLVVGMFCVALGMGLLPVSLLGL